MQLQVSNYLIWCYYFGGTVVFHLSITDFILWSHHSITQVNLGLKVQQMARSMSATEQCGVES